LDFLSIFFWCNETQRFQQRRPGITLVLVYSARFLRTLPDVLFEFIKPFGIMLRALRLLPRGRSMATAVAIARMPRMEQILAAKG
jgi:hypothetical protein